MPQIVAYKVLKDNRKITKPSTQRVGAVAYNRWSFMKASSRNTLTWKNLDKSLLMRCGHTWGFKCFELWSSTYIIIMYVSVIHNPSPFLSLNSNSSKHQSVYLSFDSLELFLDLFKRCQWMLRFLQIAFMQEVVSFFIQLSLKLFIGFTYWFFLCSIIDRRWTASWFQVQPRRHKWRFREWI